MTDHSSEIQYLLNLVASRFGGRLETTTDFDALANAIEDCLRMHISASTLKRLWGYVNLHPRPRTETLDILSKYAGRKDFRDICQEWHNVSGFISTDYITTSGLKPYEEVVLCWNPSRRVRLIHLGNKRFRVLDPGGSKLEVGDEFEINAFLKGHPLYLEGINRKGKILPPYVAGKTAGIISIEVKDK